MARIILFLCLFLSTTTHVYAQDEIRLNDGTLLKELDAPYLSVFPSIYLIGGQSFRAQIEYLPRRRPFIYDKKGQMRFESKTAILNLMHQQGYNLIQAITDNEGEVVYYLMERREN